MVVAAVFLLLGPSQPYLASAHTCSSQRFAKLKKAAAKFGQSTTPNVTPPKAAAPAMVPKTRKAALRSAKSTKAAGTKRKRAESVDVSNHDSEEDRATASVNDKDDEIPKKKVKAEPKGRQMEIIKTKEKLADGSLDLAQDS